MKKFKCSICATENTYAGELTREFGPECSKCASNSRYRYLAMLLGKLVWKEERAISEVSKKDFRGAGTSEYIPLCEMIAQKCNFKNTYFHYEPSDDLHLDITNPQEKNFNHYDFFISSEVFEHIPSPVSRAFDGAAKILKQHGTFIFTVPYTLEAKTQEHFHDLHNYKLVTLDGEKDPILVNRAKDGKLTTFDNLIFHGGPGHTLEHRVFCKDDIKKNLINAGFKDIHFWEENFSAWGAGWEEGWSRPVSAVKA